MIFEVLILLFDLILFSCYHFHLIVLETLFRECRPPFHFSSQKHHFFFFFFYQFMHTYMQTHSEIYSLPPASFPPSAIHKYTFRNPGTAHSEPTCPLIHPGSRQKKRQLGYIHSIRDHLFQDTWDLDCIQPSTHEMDPKKCQDYPTSEASRSNQCELEQLVELRK